MSNKFWRGHHGCRPIRLGNRCGVLRALPCLNAELRYTCVRMKRVVLILGTIFWVFALVRSAVAQTTNTWRGEYFANRNLQGTPVFTRDDPSVDFNWRNSSPGAGIPADDFSVRWTRWYFITTPGNWTFTTLTDDGVRLFVDDRLVIDAWQDQPLTVQSVTLNLSPSFHLVRMEYYERRADAQAHLWITAPDYPDWRGEYYNNPNLAGTPAFVRNDSAINFDFGTAGPGGNVPGTNFSVRWTRSQFFNAGHYRFTTTTDDGVRLWLDGQLLIDQWKDQTLKSWSADITLTEGTHWLQMDYYQRGGNARAVLTWTAEQTTEFWRGEYFSNPSLEGAPVFTRDESDLDFDWGTSAPGRGIKNSDWSARWTTRRMIYAPGYYTVVGIGDDGFRVWVDNTLLIDEWHDQPPTPHAAVVYLNAGQHDWRVEYYQHSGTALMRTRIVRGIVEPGRLAPGEIVIDSQHVGFIKSNTAWQAVATSAGKTAYIAQNQALARSSRNEVRWYPGLTQPGEYEIWAYIPANLATTHRAQYTIVHANTFDTRTLNQSLYLNEWVSLGKYYFAATGDEYVLLTDVTYEPDQSAVIVADALKFSAR